MGKPKLKPRGKPFAGKDDPRARQNIQAAAAALYGPEPEPELSVVAPGPPGGPPVNVDGVPQQLLDMRSVYGNPASADRTHGHKICRAWLKDDVKSFMAAMTQLEAKLLAATEGKPGDEGKQDGLPVGPQEEKVRGLLDRLIADEDEQQAEEDAKLARQPGAAQLGLSRQAELKDALGRERLLIEKVAALKQAGAADDPDSREAVLGGMFERFWIEQRAEDAELALRPDPEKVVGSLQKALEGTREREEHWRGWAAELERAGQA